MLQCAQEQASNFCTACFDGNYPIPVEVELREHKLMLEPSGLAQS